MRVAVVGGVCKDIFGKEERFGGITYNCIAGARLNKKVVAITKAGKEDLMKWSTIMEKNGVKVIGKEDRTTKLKTMYKDEKRIQIPVSLSSRIEKVGIESELIHFNPLFENQVSMDAIKEGRKKSKIVSLDVQGFVRHAVIGKRIEHKPMKNAKEILRNVDLLKISDIELEYVLSGLEGSVVKVDGIFEHIKGLKKIANSGPSIVELTYGRKGSMVYWREKGETIFFPAFATKNVDETGAGDVFSIVFAIMFAESNSIKEAGMFATVASSFCVEMPAYHGIPDEKKILERVKEYERRICVERFDGV
ncbi:MAG: PfkB family carbohydrate kinase [Candidatus Anstonellales archaeon]